MSLRYAALEADPYLQTNKTQLLEEVSEVLGIEKVRAKTSER